MQKHAKGPQTFQREISSHRQENNVMMFSQCKKTKKKENNHAVIHLHGTTDIKI